MLTLLKLFSLTLLAVMPQQEPLGEFWGTEEEESKYYKLVDIPLPKELAVEAGSFEVMPDQQQLAIATRRGDIFLADGAFDEHPEPTFKKFASGLDEVFGMAYRDGSFHVTQQAEVTRITDTDGDGRADRFDTLSDAWGFRHYHEFSFGSKPDKDGNIWVALCLSKSYHSDAPFRGWCLKITPDGQTIPVCSGIRSPCGIGPNEHGVMFYAESQGPWNGSCSLKVLQPGGFMGHPISFNWYKRAELGEAPVVPNTPSRLETERKRVKELVPYAVVFPYKRMGRSISGFMVDRSGGKFGPFENQIFIGDFSLGVVMRATTEQVNGVWQGACYPFREGFDTGLLAVQFTPDGSLIAGGTNRGWPVRGPKAYAVQRLDWTGLVPFEIKEIKAKPKGFEIAFTKPVDRALASNPDNYQLKTFTHIYRQGYGSPEVDQTEPKATRAVVSPDGMKVTIELNQLTQGHVHDFYLPEMRSAENEKLLHASAYYTLNEIPKPAVKAKDVGTTKGLIDFQRPSDAEQLVGEAGSSFIPESKVPSQWTFEDGVLTASPKWDSVITPESYQDFRMHIEFNVNDAGDVPAEKNGNSGVYIQQRYELQILNSYAVPENEYKSNFCGSIYRVKKPDQLACKPAGEWQSFDIAFRAARFDGQAKTQNACITVYQNGKLIHDNYFMKRKTGAGKKEAPTPGPIKLQGHHNQVKFRNVWIQRLSLDDSNTSLTNPPTIQQDLEQANPDVELQVTPSDKELPLSGESFKLNNHDAFVILPPNAQTDIPWVWYAPTLPRLPAKEEQWMFQHFLDAGIAIAGIDVGESYGSPEGRKIYNAFHQHLVQERNFNQKACLLARSRGGLMLYNWAVENPKSVACIAGIYPVCNLASYPGIDRACGAYGLTEDQLNENLKKHNPIDRLAPLAKFNVPIFHIHGDVDTVVPLKDNSGPLAERYTELGGKMILEVIQGQGHNMWEGWFQSKKLVEFVIEHAQTEDQHPVPKSEKWLTYSGGDGPGKGKHIVLIAAEQEYRCEQSMPMLAKVLSEHHGFDCTVLFALNDRGEVDPSIPAPFKDKTKRHNIPGLEYLADADCVIWLSRFMQLPDDQMKCFHDYFDSGKPLIALRTANHGFWGGKKYFKGETPVSVRELLGGAFMGHHGGWHRESTQGIIVPEQKTHPILMGVDNIWGPSDVYRCHNEKSPFPDDCTALVMGQPLLDLTPTAAANTKKEPLPIAWTKTWTGNNGHSTRIFHFTMGSAKDFENEGVRRLTVNAVYWGLGMESAITADRSVEPIGNYQPRKSGFNYEKFGIRPQQPKFLR